jgi:hypothetical protein
MKKMIPVYALQVLMLGAFLFVSLRLLREVSAMHAEIERAQAERNSPFQEQKPIKVIVVNTPTVEVDNEPYVHIAP